MSTSWFIWVACAAALLLGAGCATAPVRDWESKTFEFPYVHDYKVVNRTTFPWRDDFLSADSRAYSQELAGPLSALAATWRSSERTTISKDKLLAAYHDIDMGKICDRNIQRRFSLKEDKSNGTVD